MWVLLRSIFGATRSLFKTRRELALENLALRQQIGVLSRTLNGRRLRLRRWDRALVGRAVPWLGGMEGSPGHRRATATFRVLFGLVVLEHHRRRVLHFNVTANPTAEWTARQIMEAFPEDTAPRFLVRDRDKIYGERFRRTVEALGIEEVVTAAKSPWQNPYAERLIGSLRRECLDQVIVLDETHLRRILARYFEYYHRARCHLSLAGDAPEPRAIQEAEEGDVVEFPEVGGLHHRYERRAA